MDKAQYSSLVCPECVVFKVIRHLVSKPKSEPRSISGKGKALDTRHSINEQPN